MQNLTTKLFKPIDNSQLIVFRIIFGILICYEALVDLYRGNVKYTMVKPPYIFKFIGFDCLEFLHGPIMYYWFGAMAICGILIIVGAYYRAAIISFAVLWTGYYLTQKTFYNNHYYLMILLSVFMIFMPANANQSYDAKRNPAIQSNFCMQWVTWLFIAQMMIVYFYAAVNKIYPDWFNGRFLGNYFITREKFPVFGWDFHHKHWFHLFLAYGGFLFDLTIIPLFLWKRTRMLALLLSFCFHLFNVFNFNIGVFPYLALSLNVFFFDPKEVSAFFFPKREYKEPYETSGKDFFSAKHKKIYITAFTIYLLIQILLPLRYLMYEGNVNWTDEGHRLSWRMMMRSKRGEIHYKVIDSASGKQWIVEPAKRLITMQYIQLAGHPDMIWQYAQELKRECVSKNYPNVKVYAISYANLNSRPMQLFIDSTVDLANMPWHHFKHSPWILPYKE